MTSPAPPKPFHFTQKELKLGLVEEFAQGHRAREGQAAHPGAFSPYHRGREGLDSPAALRAAAQPCPAPLPVREASAQPGKGVRQGGYWHRRGEPRKPGKDTFVLAEGTLGAMTRVSVSPGPPSQVSLRAGRGSSGRQGCSAPWVCCGRGQGRGLLAALPLLSLRPTRTPHPASSEPLLWLSPRPFSTRGASEARLVLCHLLQPLPDFLP